MQQMNVRGKFLDSHCSDTRQVYDDLSLTNINSEGAKLVNC